MFEILKLKRELKEQRKRLEIRQGEFALKQMERAKTLLERIKDQDEDEWIQIGLERKEFTESDLETMRGQAYKLWMVNPHAHGLIECMVTFIIGKRMNVNAQDENPLVQEWWDEFEKANKFGQKQKEIVRRTLRDGECFIRYFVDVKEGTTKIRFLEPSEISDASNQYSHGIQTNPDDIEEPINYYRVKNGKHREAIPAREIQHIKILADSNVKRGTSFLYPVMPMIKKYEQWLQYRIVLNIMRSAVILTKKVSGAAPSQVSGVAAERAASVGMQMAKMLKPGTTITHGEGIEYNFLSPNIQAADAQLDGRAILLAIAVGTQTAEYMASGDASNANYSSTMVAESPPVRMFEYWQSFFEEVFQEMFHRVINAGIIYGQIPDYSKKTKKYQELRKIHKSEEEVPTNTDCDIGFGGLIARNIKEETEAILAQMNAGLIGREKAAEKLGYDYWEELEKIIFEEISNEEMRGTLSREEQIKKEPEEE